MSYQSNVAAQEATLIAHYLRLRQARTARKKEFEEADAVDKASMTKIEGYFLKKFTVESGATGMKTTVGSVSVSTKDYPQVKDRAAFNAWVLETGMIDVLNRTPNKTAINEYAAENGGQLPAGIQITSERKVSITKART